MGKKQDLVGMDGFQELSNAVNKKYGQGAIIIGDEVLDTPRISTGSLGLDIATGGGWGRGRIHEIFGPESSGKSTLCYLTLVEAQKRGEGVAFVDAEHAFDREYAVKLGLDMSKLIISQPDHGEMGLDIAEMLISSGKVSVCIIDSVAALTPLSEIEGEMDQASVGTQARMMSKGLRKLTATVNKTGTVLIFTNQLRHKIGVMFGNPETTPGGQALKFYASIRVDMRGTKGHDDADGQRMDSKVNCKVIKNKLAAPFQKCTFDIVFGKGIDRIGEILEFAIVNDVITQNGAWFSYGETKLGHGRDKVSIMLNDNPELLEELEGKIKFLYDLK